MNLKMLMTTEIRHRRKQLEEDLLILDLYILKVKDKQALLGLNRLREILVDTITVLETKYSKRNRDEK